MATTLATAGTFKSITLPDGRVVTSPAITSGIEIMARGLEAQGKTAEAAAIRAMGIKKLTQAQQDALPLKGSNSLPTVSAPAGGSPGGGFAPLALAAGGFFVAGPLGAVAGLVAGSFIGRKSASPATAVPVAGFGVYRRLARR
jgi:hypothetical protein